MLGIYAINHKATCTKYVGSSVDISGRWYAHRVELRRGEHCNRKLQQAWTEYGEDAFEFYLLESIEDGAQLLEREQFWIDFFDAAIMGYNIMAAGEIPKIRRGRTRKVRVLDPKKEGAAQRAVERYAARWSRNPLI